jgi:hypothetical protein
VEQIIGAEKKKESKFYQEIMQEEERIARRANILRVLRVRFGAEPTREVAVALDAVDDVRRLERFLELAATCAGLAGFRVARPRGRH